MGNSKSKGEYPSYSAYNEAKSTYGRAYNAQHLPGYTSVLGFHHIHGINIELQANNRIAKRTSGFCDAIVFSSRRIRRHEKFILTLDDIDNGWSGALRIGFTSVNPQEMSSALPKYVCPDLTKFPGYWAKALSTAVCQLNNEIIISVNGRGELNYSVNYGPEQTLFDGIDVSGDLWAIFDLYGITKSVMIRAYDEDLTATLDLPLSNSRHIQLPTDMISLAASTFELGTDHLEPISFSATMGAGLKCRNRIHVTRKEDYADDSCVAFTNVRLGAGQTAYFYCAECREQRLSSLLEEINFGIGITTCDPTTLPVGEIPCDASSLMDRPEYWVFYREFANPRVGEFFSISVEREGMITYTRQFEDKDVLFHADVYEPLHIFVDLSGPVSSLAVVGISGSCVASCSNSTSALNSLGLASIHNTANRNDRDEYVPMGYPHENDWYHQSGSGSSEMVPHVRPGTPQLPVSTYPHEYVLCSPQIPDDISSDDDFHDSVDNQTNLDRLAISQTPDAAGLSTCTSTNKRPATGDCAGTSSSQRSKSDDKAIKKGEASGGEAECVICCDVTANSVMYPCGHACLCYNCGQVILKQKSSHCPICRATVKDVIRIYQS